MKQPTLLELREIEQQMPQIEKDINLIAAWLVDEECILELSYFGEYMASIRDADGRVFFSGISPKPVKAIELLRIGLFDE